MSEQYPSPPPPPPPGGYQGGPPGGYQGGYAGGYQGGPPPAKPTNVLAIVALVAGIIAFLTGLVPVLGLLLGIAAVVLGVLGLRKARALYGSGKGLAITALVLGGIAALTSLGTTVLAGALSGSSTTSSASAPTIAEPSESASEAAPAPEESSEAPAPAQSSEAPAPAAGQFPGQTADDQVAQPGSPITIDGLTITSTPLAAQSDIFGQQYCTTVSYQNGGQQSESYNLFDWNVLNPNGASESATITGVDGQLSSGELAPGGKVSGLVCFKDTSVAPGTNVVLYEAPSLFSSERGAWVNQVG